MQNIIFRPLNYNAERIVTRNSMCYYWHMQIKQSLAIEKLVQFSQEMSWKPLQ